MRLLLDECLPKRLKRAFVGFDVVTVPEVGWAGVKDKTLLEAAGRAGFDAFITIDGGMKYQQNLERITLRVVALRAPSNRLEDIEPLIPLVLDLLPTLVMGEYRSLTACEQS